MFHRPNKKPSESLRHELKAQLQERLRTALEFATLGAYELSGEPLVGGASQPAHPPATREPQTRVFLFAKVSSPCPHGPVQTTACDAAGADTGGHHRAV